MDAKYAICLLLSDGVDVPSTWICMPCGYFDQWSTVEVMLPRVLAALLWSLGPGMNGPTLSTERSHGDALRYMRWTGTRWPQGSVPRHQVCEWDQVSCSRPPASWVPPVTPAGSPQSRTTVQLSPAQILNPQLYTLVFVLNPLSFRGVFYTAIDNPKSYMYDYKIEIAKSDKLWMSCNHRDHIFLLSEQGEWSDQFGRARENCPPKSDILVIES